MARLKMFDSAIFRSACLMAVTGYCVARPIGEPSPAPRRTFAIDQTRYFESPAQENADLQEVLAEAHEFIASPDTEGKNVGPYLQKAERLLGLLQRHSAYLYLRASRDIDDRIDADASDTVDAAQRNVKAAAQDCLRKLGHESFTEAALADPSLSKYEYLLKQAETQSLHELPADQQAVLDKVATPAATNLWILYRQTMRPTLFPRIETLEGPLDVKTDARLLNANPDRSIRRRAWESRMDGYASRADVYAGILVGVVKTNVNIAQLRKFPDAPPCFIFDEG